MSDRRSFSEIPSEVLRDGEDGERIDRIWARLERDISPGAVRRRGSGRLPILGVAALTFALGVAVGVRFASPHAPSPAPLLVAQPEAPLRDTVPASGPALAPSAAEQARRGVEPSRRVSPPHRVESVTGEARLLSPPNAPKVAATPEWQRLADEGQYVQALSALESSGGFDVALRDATVDQLMSLVDVARATGERDRAITALRRVVTEHEADPNAPVAAWMLATELSKAHDYAAAERAFAMYRALSPGGDFAEDALARQMDMAVEEGHLEGARKLGEQYIKEFPNGPRSAEIQAELGAWTRDAGASGALGPSGRSDPDGGASR